MLASPLEIISHISPPYSTDGQGWSELFANLEPHIVDALAETYSTQHKFNQPITIGFSEADGVFYVGNGCHRLAAAYRVDPYADLEIDLLQEVIPENTEAFYDISFKLTPNPESGFDFAFDYLRSYPLGDGWIESYTVEYHNATQIYRLCYDSTLDPATIASSIIERCAMAGYKCDIVEALIQVVDQEGDIVNATTIAI